MGPYIGIVIFSAIVIGIAVASFSWFSHSRRGWEQLAVERGFSLRGSYFSPVLEGRYGGVEVEVRLERRRVGRNDQRYTRYRVEIGAPMPAGFCVRKEGLLQLLGKVVGIHDDIQVGNPELDDALMITGDDMVRIIRLLNISEVGAAVLGMVIAHPQIEIGQRIEIEEHGMAEAMHIESVLDGLCDLARALEAGNQRLAVEDGCDPPPAALR
jgi:hypothetical protein